MCGTHDRYESQDSSTHSWSKHDWPYHSRQYGCPSPHHWWRLVTANLQLQSAASLWTLSNLMQAQTFFYTRLWPCSAQSLLINASCWQEKYLAFQVDAHHLLRVDASWCSDEHTLWWARWGHHIWSNTYCAARVEYGKNVSIAESVIRCKFKESGRLNLRTSIAMHSLVQIRWTKNGVYNYLSTRP